jgi:hypothetical protein
MEQIGTVIAVPVKDKDIWAGMELVLCSGGKAIDLVKVSHITLQGNYYIIGPNTACEMTEDMYLTNLYIQTKEGAVHKIKFKQWYKLIKNKLINSGRSVIFELLPSTFSTGFYSKLCTSCGAYFAGNKKQQECEECSEANRYAVVDLKILPQRNKRKRIIKKDDSV